MTMEDNSIEVLTSAQTSALVTEKEPSPPSDLSEAEIDEIKAMAVAAIEALRDSTGAKELELVDNITNVGAKAQRQAGTELNLLRTRISGMMADSDNSSGTHIAKDLVDLRVALNQIDPHGGGNTGIRRVAGLIPFGRQTVLKRLETIALRYEPVSRQVVIIETRLREGHTMLGRDNIDLRKLYEQVEAQHASVQRNIYLGELLTVELDKLLQETQEPQKRERLQNALFDVTGRVQDLRTTDEVHNQLFVGIEMTRQNNRRLAQAVERSITMAGNVVMVGLAIQTALARQSRVLEATRRTREFLGEMLASNAAAIARHTKDIGDLYTSPVIAIDKITQAHNDLLEAIDTANDLRAQGIATARENASTLARLAGEMERRSGILMGPDASSIEV
jgi:uncharacterized protein YaaN involved in tellurite resistance